MEWRIPGMNCAVRACVQGGRWVSQFGRPETTLKDVTAVYFCSSLLVAVGAIVYAIIQRLPWNSRPYQLALGLVCWSRCVYQYAREELADRPAPVSDVGQEEIDDEVQQPDTPSPSTTDSPLTPFGMMVGLLLYSPHKGGEWRSPGGAGPKIGVGVCRKLTFDDPKK